MRRADCSRRVEGEFVTCNWCGTENIEFGLGGHTPSLCRVALAAQLAELRAVVIPPEDYERSRKELHKQAVDADARADRAEKIIDRFSTWIDHVCGPIALSRMIEKTSLIDAWDDARAERSP